MSDACPECGRYKGHGLIGFGDPCPHTTREELIAELKLYYKSWREVSDKFHNRCIEYQRNANLWHGRWSIVKHENNQLRKKLFQRSKPQT